MRFLQIAFLAQVFSTFAMTGLIWFVQIVHYPLFSIVNAESFPEYEKRHANQTTWVVAPLKLVELATAVLFACNPAWFAQRAESYLGLTLVVVIWLSTAFLQVPMHNRLGIAFDASSHSRLVVTNWLRTVCWSARSGIILIWLCRSVRAG